MKYTIEEVLNEKQAKEFLLLPVSLYKNDENWVRPLDNDITKVFDPEKNPFFKHGECTRWLLRDEKGCSVVDLPGIYSLRPYTQEEIVTRDFIINQKPDGIINIVDATNIERNLYLTLQLLELRVPMVLALNMMDEVRANGGSIDVQKMIIALGIPVVPIAAAKGEGVSELVDQAITVARRKVFPKVTDFCSETSAVHRCIHAVMHLIADHADRIGIPARFCAAKLIEGGDDLSDQLGLDENEKELLEHCIVQMEAETGLDRNAALADMRYSFIEGVVEASVVKCHESREHARSMKIDRILTVYRYSNLSGNHARDLLSHLSCYWAAAIRLVRGWSQCLNYCGRSCFNGLWY